MFVEEAAVEAPPSAPAGALADLPLEHLEAEICQLAADLTAGMARWLSLVAEYDARDGWWSWDGLRSTADWVAWRCALAPRAAREHVRVARALRELPLTSEALASGSLSYSKVRVLSRVADRDSEPDLLELARHATAAQLERMVGAFRRVSAGEAQDAYERRHVSHFYDQDGSLCLYARLPAEEGALVLAALESAHRTLRDERAGADRGPAEPQRPSFGDPPEHPRPTRADAFVSLAETALARGPTPLPGPERNQLTVHVDLDALCFDRDGTVHLRDGPALSPETARRLGCDSSVISVLERQGEVLSVGRKTRSVPPAIRRALEVRDGGCRFPGCNNRRWLDAHHIKHWSHGGETKLDNLILLCRHHHRLLHEAAYTVEGQGGGELVFRYPRGRVIANAPPLPAGDRADLPTKAGPLLTGSGERMDLRSCVDAVFAATGRA